MALRLSRPTVMLTVFFFAKTTRTENIQQQYAQGWRNQHARRAECLPFGKWAHREFKRWSPAGWRSRHMYGAPELVRSAVASNNSAVSPGITRNSQQDTGHNPGDKEAFSMSRRSSSLRRTQRIGGLRLSGTSEHVFSGTDGTIGTCNAPAQITYQPEKCCICATTW